MTESGTGGRAGPLGLGGLAITTPRDRDWDDEPEGREREQLGLAGFYIGGQLYGIDIMRIKEVIQARPYPVRPVPHAPSIVEGVIQLRGVVKWFDAVKGYGHFTRRWVLATLPLEGRAGEGVVEIGAGAQGPPPPAPSLKGEGRCRAATLRSVVSIIRYPAPAVHSLPGSRRSSCRCWRLFRFCSDRRPDGRPRPR